ncbi:hypothetical protein MKX01_029686 [Papaver californicum]|nr:hypothetical protein MKX01_029686 [Papaver californicum]
MPMISKSLINTKQLKSTIVSLFRSSSSVKLSSTTNSSILKPNLSTLPDTHLLPLFFSKAFTSKPSLLSNSFSHTRVTHGGGPRNFCSISSLLLTECEVNYQASSSSSEVNGTTQNIKRKNLWTLWTVRAYCLSHKIDLMGLIYENQANLIPHTPGIGNYIVLRFDDLTDSPTPPRDSYMVVFKYGSTVMFNMLDHEVGGYLKIIKRHASGMLPETTKDEETLHRNT